MAHVIYRFVDYRAFLREQLRVEVEINGVSYRELSRRCQLSSPNYLQQVAAGKRNLTDASAQRVARGLGLGKRETAYLAAMVELDAATAETERTKLRRAMRKLAATATSADKRVKDLAIHSSWLCEVLVEMAYLKGVTFTRAFAIERMRGLATPEEVERAFDVLVAKRYVVAGKGEAFVPSGTAFEPLNDVRTAELRAVHQRFLEIAKHRLTSDLEQREYQGLTIAVAASKMELVRTRMREFVAGLCEELAHDEDADRVLRVQLSAFRVG